MVDWIYNRYRECFLELFSWEIKKDEIQSISEYKRRDSEYKWIQEERQCLYSNQREGESKYRQFYVLDKGRLGHSHLVVSLLL